MTSLITAIIKFFTALVAAKLIRRRSDPASPMLPIEIALEQINQTYHILNQMMVNAGAGRVLLLMTTNGGGIPTAGSVVKSSVLREVFSKELDPVREFWQNQLIDQHYAGLISDIRRGDAVEVIAERIPEKSQLRTIYDAGGVAFGIVCWVASLEDRFLYVTLNYHRMSELKSPGDLSPAHREAIRAGVNKLKAIHASPGKLDPMLLAHISSMPKEVPT